MGGGAQWLATWSSSRKVSASPLSSSNTAPRNSAARSSSSCDGRMGSNVPPAAGMCTVWSNPRPLSVLDLSPANLADRWNDLRGDQIAPAYLVPRHVPHDSDQAGDFEHRAWPASRREPAHRLENQAQTQTSHDGARCHQETDRAYRD